MSGSRDGEVLVVDPGRDACEVTIGRMAPCTVLIEDDPELSRAHGRLALRHGEWWLEDLGSANGTFLGEFGRSARVKAPVKLNSGQIFKVGLTRIRAGLTEGWTLPSVDVAQAVAR
jgi:pSer/pThr/pTyr-binding forkhead associated (FHA) protein